jgi:hypothetical protein
MKRGVVAAVAALVAAGCGGTAFEAATGAPAAEAGAEAAPRPDAAPTEAAAAPVDAGGPDVAAESAEREAGGEGAAPEAAGPPAYPGCVVSACPLCPGDGGACSLGCGDGVYVGWSGGRCDPSLPSYTGGACAVGAPCVVGPAAPGAPGNCPGVCAASD